MGKSKGAQRTKGNVKPSSSGHSAELLASTGKIGFVGFSNSKVGQHVAQTSDNTLDGTFTMAMKRMIKRDATTKLKAIQEFRDLCCEKEKETVLAVLAFWPRLYNKLALEYDRRIREATQEANAKLIDKVNRDIAPFLKNMMGVWLLAQSDPYPPAASVALNAFTSTFPLEKQSDTLMFCKEEILLYFKDNLFEQTLQSLSEPHIPAEEVEQKYVMVIAGTLHGLKLFLNMLSTDAKEQTKEDVKSIVTHGKFWKLAKNKNSQIRVAWYNLISVLCHHMPEVFLQCENKLGHAVLGCLSESNPVLAPAVWEAALHYVAGFENCWDNLDINKVVLPELWIILGEGGRGNAHLLFPCLLPFLSKLPIDIIKQQKNFFPRFFSSISSSLFLDGVKKSTSECNAIVTAFIECLQYVCLHLGKDAEWQDIAKELISSQLLPLVEKSFAMEGSHLPVSTFYSSLGALIQSLESTVIERDDMRDIYHKEVSNFWSSISLIAEQVLNRDHLPQHADLVFLAYFFHCMHEPSNLSPKKKKGKIKFADDVPESSEKAPASSSNCTSSFDIRVGKRTELFSCTTDICLLLCQKLEVNIEPHYLNLLVEILSAAKCCDLFQHLLKRFKSIDCSNSESPYSFFQVVITQWLKEERRTPVLMNMIDAIFIICYCLDKDSVPKVLNQCCLVDNPKFLERMLQRFVSMKEEKLFCKWLKSSELASTIVNVFVFVISKWNAKDIDLKTLESYFPTLRTCLVQLTSKEFSSDMKYIADILSVVKSSLEPITSHRGKWEEVDIKVIEFLCSETENIFVRLKECWHLPVADALMMIFLELNLTKPFENESLTLKIHDLWLTCVRELAVVQYDFQSNSKFFSRTSGRLHDSIIKPVDNISLASIVECISELLFTLTNVFSVIDDEENKDSSVLIASSILQRMLPSIEDWIQIKEDTELSLSTAYLEKKLLYPLPAERIDLVMDVIFPFNILVTTQAVSEILVNHIGPTVLGEEKKETIETVLLQLPHLLGVFSYCETAGFLKNKNDTRYSGSCKLQRNCFQILACLPKEEAISHIHALFKLAIDDPQQWILPFENALVIVKTQQTINALLIHKLYQQLRCKDTVGSQLMAQMLIHYMSDEMKVELAMSFVTQLLIKESRCQPQTLALFCCCLREFSALNLEHIQRSSLKILKKSLNEYWCDKVLTPRDDAVHIQICCLISELVTKCPDMISPLLPLIQGFCISSLKRCHVSVRDYGLEAFEFIRTHYSCSMTCQLLSLMTDDASSDNVYRYNLDFIKDISWSLVDIFVKVSDSFRDEKSVPRVMENFLSILFASIEFVPADILLVSVVSVAKAPHEEVISIALGMLLPSLTSDLLSLQLTTHSIMSRILPLVPEFSKCPDDQVNKEVEDLETPKRVMPLMNLLKSLTEVVESMLSDLKIGEHCVILPNTDSYTYTMAFLFAWIEFLDFLAASNSQERFECVSHLESNQSLTLFLSCLFRLLPEKAAVLVPSEKNSKNSDSLKNIFIQPPVLSSSDPLTNVDLQRLACHTFYNALKKMPAMIRTWCHGLDKRSFEAVNKFTVKYVSALLASKELQAVQEHNLQLNNMTVQACPSAREVVATYVVDGYSVELIIQLPVNHPLGSLNIEKHGIVKLNRLKWRQWLMQLTSFLTYQNGSILDGLLLWKKNLDKTFEGLEECFICYFILHSTTYELPKKSCPTCKKKFHSSCIHKWFVTSNNATCPLCRHLW